MWQQVFIDHTDWVGEYKFHSDLYKFTMTIQSVHLDDDGSILALFTGPDAKFDVKGTNQNPILLVNWQFYLN